MMPWERPDLKELVARREEDLSAKLLDGSPLRLNSVLSVIARMQAAGEHTLHAFLAWGFLQCFPDKAEAAYLEGWARVWGVIRKGAEAAQGFAAASGTAGATIADGLVATDPRGARYELGGAILGLDGEASVAIKAEAAGIAGNIAENTKLTLVSPAAGVSPTLTVRSPGIAGGTDAEDDEALRARVLKVIRSPPHGGNKADYEVWALEIAAVKNALCIPTMHGLGTVGVAIWGDPENVVLAQVTIDETKAHILEKCPVTAGPGLYVFMPEIVPIDFNIRLLPDSSEVRETALRELKDVFAREAQPGVKIPLSHLREAVSIAAGEYDHRMLAPDDDITPGPGELPVIGEVVFSG
jgi:uncharacterized phage protein gp47/JayE